MSKQPLPVQPPVVRGPAVVAQLSIALMESGNVAVRGSIDDLIFAYGMLEMAKDAIRANAQHQAASPLLLPPSARMRPTPAPTQDVRKPEEQETDSQDAGSDGTTQQGAG